MYKKWLVAVLVVWILLSLLSMINSKYFVSDVQHTESVNILNKSTANIQIKTPQSSSFLYPGEKSAFQVDIKKSIQERMFQILNSSGAVIFSYRDFVRPANDNVT